MMCIIWKLFQHDPSWLDVINLPRTQPYTIYPIAEQTWGVSRPRFNSKSVCGSFADF